MPRRTKIVATLGPATNTQAAIEKLILAGATVFRFNFSHGSAQDHIERAIGGAKGIRLGLQFLRHHPDGPQVPGPQPPRPRNQSPHLRCQRQSQPCPAPRWGVF